MLRPSVRVAILVILLAFTTILIPSRVLGATDANENDHSHSIRASTLAARHSALLSRVRSYDRTKPELVGGIHSMSDGDDDRHGLFPVKQHIKINTLGNEFNIQLEKNERVVADDYQHIRLDFGGGAKAKGERAKLVHSHTSRDHTPARHCYYHGHVVGDPNSWVAIDTCHGLSGVVHAHGETFALSPDMLGYDEENTNQEGSTRSTEEGSRPRNHGQGAPKHMHTMSTNAKEQHEKISHDHIIYRLQDYEPLQTVCGVTQDDEVRHFHAQAALKMKEPRQEAIQTSPPQSKRGSKGSYLSTPLTPGAVPGDQKFVELLVINDFERFKQQRENAEHDALALINLVDSYYRVTKFQYTYRIVLVGQVTFVNGDPYYVPFTGGARPNVPDPNQSTPTPEPTPNPDAPQANGTDPNAQPPAPAPTPTPTPPTPTPQPTDPNTIPTTPYDPTQTQPTNPYNPYNPYVQPTQPTNPYNPYYPYLQPTTPTTPTYNPYMPYTPYAPVNPYFSPGGTSGGMKLGRATGVTVETQGFQGLLEVFNDWHAKNKDLPRRDNTQLFSGLNFASGVLGLANVGMCCTPEYSGSVCAINEASPAANAVILAHETGHTLGMSHDSSGNECPQSGYIMAAVAGVGTTFSTCSIKYTDNWMATNSPTPVCIADVPTVWLSDQSEISLAGAATGTAAAPTPAPAPEVPPTPVAPTPEPAPVSPTPAPTAHAQKSTAEPVSAALPTPPTDSWSPWLIGTAAFLTGCLASLAASQLWRKCRETKSLLSQDELHVKSSPSPVHAQGFSLNIAPSAPSTPMATTALKPVDDSSSATSHHTQHITRAKRRTSLGSTPSLLPHPNGARIPDTIPSESPEAQE